MQNYEEEGARRRVRGEALGTDRRYATPYLSRNDANREALRAIAAYHLHSIDEARTADSQEISSISQQTNVHGTNMDELNEEAQSSTLATLHHSIDTQLCTACDDRISPQYLAHAPCGHVYCKGCFGYMIQNAIKNEPQFPPKCCTQEIPIEGNEHFLDPEIIADFRLKVIEYATPDRLYCHVRTCSTFIPQAAREGHIGTCPKCNKQTCLECRDAKHPYECSGDKSLLSIMHLAEKEGWQQCQKCKAIVERNGGCNHILCRCGHQFCYVCGKKWKTCNCPPSPEGDRIEILGQIMGFGQRLDNTETDRETRRAMRNNRVRPAWRPNLTRARIAMPGTGRTTEGGRPEEGQGEAEQQPGCTHRRLVGLRKRYACRACNRVSSYVEECWYCYVNICFHCREPRQRLQASPNPQILPYPEGHPRYNNQV